VISLAFDGIDNTVYWSTGTKGYEGIYRGKLDGSTKPELVASGLTMPEGVAIDWVGRNVYITDSNDSKTKRQTGTAVDGPPRIIVCSADGAMCHVLIKDNVDKPRAIVLHPEEGYV
jgi:DNA-binding beta-propeller fold protein YncE